VADAAGTTVWRWDQAEPFGNNAANEDPDANSVAFDLPLRLPGQRYDKETGLHYSYFRDCYDSGTGRFCQPDPAGTVFFGDMGFRNLGALALAQPKLADLLYSEEPRYNHLYAYVGGNPISFTDPLGLEKGTMEQRGYPSGPTDPNAKYRICMSEELPKCPYGTVATCATICALTAPTGPGAVGCAVGCACVVGYSCYELTSMYCKGKAGL
jgi:RHS repeat-associated protein